MHDDEQRRPPYRPVPPRPAPPPQRPPVDPNAPTRRIPPRGYRPPPPEEETQVIRRDGRPDPRRAWSQTPPPPPPRQPPPRRPAPPPPAQPPRRPGGVQYAPTQRPQPFDQQRPSPQRSPGRRAAVSAPPRQRPPKPPGPPRPPRPKRTLPSWLRGGWGRKIVLILVALLVITIGTLIWVDTSLNRIDALGNYDGRPGDTKGTTWLLVGSDSRVGLTPDQEKSLATGGDVGPSRTDTIILIHLPSSGRATMVSVPRDSYVPIPGNGSDKINAAFAIGGAPLLVQTLEGATGLHIDQYAEIGFGGFAGMVDALGGLNICVKQPMDDPMAGINLQPGCQDLNGAQALGFVRSRYALAGGDLDRVQNQRQFLSALLTKATSPATLINPFRLWPMLRDTAKSLTVDNGDHVWNLAALAWALRGNPVTTTVPVSGSEDVDGSGNVLRWDKQRASALFDAMAGDQEIPAELITPGP